MRSRKLIVLVLLMTLIMVFGASSALAGEAKGPSGPVSFENPDYPGATGGPTPVNGYIAQSICSFSGLNDVIIDEPGPKYEPTLTQSYGTFIVLFGKEAVDNDPHGGSPGETCNGHTGLLAGP
jgi:hypothetical protein